MAKHGDGDQKDGSKSKDKQGTFVDPSKTKSKGSRGKDDKGGKGGKGR